MGNSFGVPVLPPLRTGTRRHVLPSIPPAYCTSAVPTLSLRLRGRGIFSGFSARKFLAYLHPPSSVRRPSVPRGQSMRLFFARCTRLRAPTAPLPLHGLFITRTPATLDESRSPW